MEYSWLEGDPKFSFEKKNINMCSPIMLEIINACLNLPYFPKDWKVTNILVISKKNRIKNGSGSSYRHINLLSNVGKIFERLISNKIDSLSYTSNWISDLQYGFVKNKSTINTLDNVLSTAENNKKQKWYTLCFLVT